MSKHKNCAHKASVSRWECEGGVVIRASGYCDDCQWNFVYDLRLKKFVPSRPYSAQERRPAPQTEEKKERTE